MFKFEKLPADILRRIPKVSQALAEDPRVLFAYVFGGCAQVEVRLLSDIDLAVYLDSIDRLLAGILRLPDKGRGVA